MEGINEGFLRKSHKVFMWIGITYVAGLFLLMTPFGQRHAVYMHLVKWPLNPKYANPHFHGLAPFKTLDFKLKTSDDVHLGAWFILSEQAYQAVSARSGPPTKAQIAQALKDRPTVLFFHGNAASRAVNYRVQVYTQLTSRLNANVLTIDYRGFGDSEGTPSEDGLGKDALAAWDWLIANGASPSQIIIMGQSLGTGVSSALASHLAKTGKSPRALALIAPFATIEKLLETYNFGGYFPVLRPLQSFPYVSTFVLKYLQSHFPTVDIIQAVECPILLVHSTDDMTIPSIHSSDIFEKLLDPQLPPWPYSTEKMFGALKYTQQQLEDIRNAGAARAEQRKGIVKQYDIGGQAGAADPSLNRPFATVREFERGEGKGRVVWVESNVGGHTDVVRFEGTVDWVGRISGLL